MLLLSEIWISHGYCDDDGDDDDDDDDDGNDDDDGCQVVTNAWTDGSAFIITVT